VTAENRSKLMEIYDEALRHWPVPFETSFVATRYGKMHVIASGDPCIAAAGAAPSVPVSGALFGPRSSGC
jgi:hypothetical protein